MLGHQRLRPLQDRGRPVEFAHDGADDGRVPLCRGAVAKGDARAHRTGAGRALRIARLDRQGPRHRPRRAARPFGRPARPDGSGRGRRTIVDSIRSTGRLSPRRRPGDRLRRGRATSNSCSASGFPTIRNGMRFTAFDVGRRAARSLGLLFDRRRRRRRRSGDRRQRPARGPLGHSPTIIAAPTNCSPSPIARA